MNTIMLFKCQLCGRWQDTRDDGECVCGAMIHELGDPHAEPEREATASVTIDVNEAVKALQELGRLGPITTNPRFLKCTATPETT